MTVQHLWEVMRKVSPDLGETEAIVLLNEAQRQYVQETLCKESSSSITLTTALSYSLPADCNAVYYIKIVIDGAEVSDRLRYSIDNATIRFEDSYDTDATKMPSEVDSITLYYYAMPTALTALTDTPTIPASRHMALAWFAMGVLTAANPQLSTNYIRLFEAQVFKGKQDSTMSQDRVSSIMRQDEMLGE